MNNSLLTEEDICSSFLMGEGRNTTSSFLSQPSLSKSFFEAGVVAYGVLSFFLVGNIIRRGVSSSSATATANAVNNIPTNGEDIQPHNFCTSIQKRSLNLNKYSFSRLREFQNQEEVEMSSPLVATQTDHHFSSDFEEILSKMKTFSSMVNTKRIRIEVTKIPSFSSSSSSHHHPPFYPFGIQIENKNPKNTHIPYAFISEIIGVLYDYSQKLEDLRMTFFNSNETKNKNSFYSGIFKLDEISKAFEFSVETHPTKITIEFLPSSSSFSLADREETPSEPLPPLVPAEEGEEEKLDGFIYIDDDED